MWDDVLDKNDLILKRKYRELNQQGEWEYLDYYDSNQDCMKIVAKGITAFLSEFESRFENSLRTRLNNKYTIDIPGYYRNYFNHCRSFFENQQRQIPFEEDRASLPDLIRDHLAKESELLQESQLFFTEVDNTEIETIKVVKKAAERYPAWVKENFLKEDHSNVHFTTIYNNDQLREIYSRSINNNVIKCYESDFMFWFTGEGTEGRKIQWIKKWGKNPYKRALFWYARKLNKNAAPVEINQVFNIEIDSNDSGYSPDKTMESIFNNL